MGGIGHGVLEMAGFVMLMLGAGLAFLAGLCAFDQRRAADGAERPGAESSGDAPAALPEPLHSPERGPARPGPRLSPTQPA